MKDYTLKRNHAFIIHYEKTEGFLYVYTSSNDCYTLPNTEHNERMLLEKMKNQILGLPDYDKEMINKMISETGYMLLNGLGTSLSCMTYEYSNFKSVNIVVAVICGYFTFKYFQSIKGNYDLVSDFQKYQIFIQYEELLNKYVDGEDLNINDLHIMSKAELLDMLSYALKEEKKLKREKKTKVSVK